MFSLLFYAQESQSGKCLYTHIFVHIQIGDPFLSSLIPKPCKNSLILMPSLRWNSEIFFLNFVKQFSYFSTADNFSTYNTTDTRTVSTFTCLPKGLNHTKNVFSGHFFKQEFKQTLHSYTHEDLWCRQIYPLCHECLQKKRCLRIFESTLSTVMPLLILVKILMESTAD